MIKVKKYELKNTIIKYGLTNSSFAEAVGLSQSYITQLLNGKKNILAPTAKRICDFFEVGFDDLFEIYHE